MSVHGSKPPFSDAQIREAMGVSDPNTLLFMPPNPGQYFAVVNGKLSLMGTKEDARKFAVLRG